MSPTEIAFGYLSILGAIRVATRISLMLNPQSAKMFTIPNKKTFSAFPIEKPPPMKDADKVRKMTIAPKERPTTENCFKSDTPFAAQSPKIKMPIR